MPIYIKGNKDVKIPICGNCGKPMFGNDRVKKEEPDICLHCEEAEFSWQDPEFWED